MKKILNRLKSPVVIAQLFTIIGSIVITLIPEYESSVKEIVYAITIIVNVFSGINNPSDKENF